MSTVAYIGLGSNEGAREERIAAALAEIARSPGVRLRRRSPLYEMEPVGGPPQGKYLNGVAEVESEIPAGDLLILLLGVEAKLGRIRGVRWGPRPIDLDLLLFGGEVHDRPELTIPHPRLREREFVLRPLADLDGTIPIPPDGAAVADLLAKLGEGRR